MNIKFFLLLFWVLIADGLMVFLMPVMVYNLTENISYTGLSYAMWWLPRIILIPLIGHFIDKFGIKTVTVTTDIFKIIGCGLLLFNLQNNPFMIAISFGVVGSIISIGNSQTLIVYEKLIALTSIEQEKHVNLLARLDFWGMILGPLLGLLLFDIGHQYLLFIPILLYLSNALFFYRVQLNDEHNRVVHETTNTDSNDVLCEITESKIPILKFIFSSGVFISMILFSIGNNMFDGIVESAGTAIFAQVMQLPVKYFAVIDIVAGLFGVLSTYLFAFLATKITRIYLLIFGIFIISISSLIMILNLNNALLFIIFYALSIAGKVITGNINRLIRIQMIPTAIFGRVISMLTLLNQSILPVVGLSLFFIDETHQALPILMFFSLLLSVLAGCSLCYRMKNETGNK